MTDPDLIVYTTVYCGDCHAAKRALQARGIAFTEIDLDGDERAADLVQSLNDGRRSVPTLVRGGVSASLSRFSMSKLDAFLGEAGLR